MERRVDPFDKSKTIVAIWRVGSDLDGSVQVRSDGSVYGEYFVLQRHPARPAWLVETVTAWGRPGALRTELNLVQA